MTISRLHTTGANHDITDVLERTALVVKSEYLWPIVREIIKTAVENHQNLIVEGCYVPPDWRSDFDDAYLQWIRFICLFMTDAYIDAHLDSITVHSSDIESRIDDTDCTLDSIKADNRWYFDSFSRCGEQITLFGEDYKGSVIKILDVQCAR